MVVNCAIYARRRKTPPSTDHRTFFHLLSHQHNHPSYRHVVSRGFPLCEQRSLCIPQCFCAIPPAGCPELPLAELRSRCCGAAERLPASMEQPCWYEDCPLLVRAPTKLHLLCFAHYGLMLTSAPQGPGNEGTTTRFTHLICLPYPEPPFRIHAAVYWRLFHVPTEHRG